MFFLFYILKRETPIFSSLSGITFLRNFGSARLHLHSVENTYLLASDSAISNGDA
jgi:hypothetical protein